MEAFEAWYEKVNRVDEVNHTDTEMAWKAALKWSYEIWKHERQSFRYQIAMEKELKDE